MRQIILSGAHNMDTLLLSIITLTLAVAGLIIVIIKPKFEKKAAEEEAQATDTQSKSQSLSLAIQLASQALSLNSRLNEVEKTLQIKTENEKHYIEQISSLNEALVVAQASIIQHRNEIDQLRQALNDCITKTTSNAAV